MIEKMESLSRQLRDLNLSNDFYVGSNLSNEANFLAKAKGKIEEQVTSSNCGFFIEKRIMCLLLSYQLRQPKQLQKFYFIRLKKFLQSKKYFIRLVGVPVIQWTKDTIGRI